MFFDPNLHGQMARDRIEREIATAAHLRRVRPSSPSIRQIVGRQIIRIGARLAAEPAFEPVRSR